MASDLTVRSHSCALLVEANYLRSRTPRANSIERQHMKTSTIAFATMAALAWLASSANASAAHHQHAHHSYKHHSHKAHVAHHHKPVAQKRKGYSRRGPLYGYGFGFSTYAGDPFYKDDYFDGRRCYYLHRQDFCRGPKSLEWLRWK